MKKSGLGLMLLLGIIIGSISMYFYQKREAAQSGLTKLSQREMSHFYDRFFNDDFFRHNKSPMEEMNKMRHEMTRMFENQMKDVSGFAFDDWYAKKFGGNISDVKQFEDENYVYYHVDLKGLDKDSVKIDVHDGQVFLSGSKSEAQTQEEKGTVSKSEFFQSFERSFPVPQGVDSSKVNFETTKNEVVIKFPKSDRGTRI